MGIFIEGDDNAAIPRPTYLVLECDVAGSFFCRGYETFNEGDYIANMSSAKRAGWVERSGSQRIFVCKECDAR
jgi:hypothetical protein